jgi:uncharacterized membrane protein
MKPANEASVLPRTPDVRASWGLPLQNLALAAFVMTAIGGAAQLLNAQTGFPFGRCQFADSLGPRWPGSLPVWLPLVWPAALLSARGVAQCILLPRRGLPNYGYTLLAMTAVLATLVQTSFDLFARHVAIWWRWEDAAWIIEGIALPNLVGCILVNIIALLLAVPALIDKRPVRSGPELLPLGVWFALNLVFLGSSLSHASDATVAVLAAPVLLATVFAFQRSRGAHAHCDGPP